MVYDCLHVYEATPMVRMAAESFGGDKVKGICVGDGIIASGCGSVKKIIMHSPITSDMLPWICENLITRLVP